MAYPVTFFEILSPDADRSRAFYSSLFGWQFEVNMENYSLVAGSPETGAISGGIGPSLREDDAGVKVYVNTVDLCATVSKALELGSEVRLDPISLPGDLGRIAIITDIDGNELGLWERTATSRGARG